MIKCPECNNLVDDNLKECNICGYPFEEKIVEHQNEDADTQPLNDVSNDKVMELQDDGQDNTEEAVNDENRSEYETHAGNGEQPDDTLMNEELNNSQFSIHSDGNDSAPENNIKSNKTRNILITSATIVLAIIVGIIAYINSDYSKYNVATKEYNNQNYAKAAETFKELENYKDSIQMYEKAKHKNDVMNDKTAPDLSVFPQKIELTQNEIFDPEQWLSDNNVVATDDVTDEIECTISSNVDTAKAGKYTLKVSAEDEAGNKITGIVNVVVKRIYSQEEIEAAVKSTYAKNIPGLDRIEYEKESKTVWVYLVNEGLAEAAVGARTNSRVKNEWDKLMDSFNQVSKKIHTHLLAEDFDDIGSVNVMLLNDLDKSKMLYVTVNGTKFMDVTD